MDDIIKSAREIAMEKVGKLGETTEEERLRWKYVPEGEKLAVRYLDQPDCSLTVELGKFDDRVKQYIKQGAEVILVRNIKLPVNDLAKRTTRRAMDGLKSLKADKVEVENIYTMIRNVFNHYTGQGEQQRKQAYESLKSDFEARMRQALQQQLGSLMGAKLDVEGQPQFQEEWHQLQAQLDNQYLKHLAEYRQKLLALS